MGPKISLDRGTLPFLSPYKKGFLVGLELRLVRVKPYVRLEYIPVRGQREYCDKIRELSGADDKDADTPDYLEATVYNKEEAVIMVGNYSDLTPEVKVNNVTRWYKPWFYKHVETFLKKARPCYCAKLNF